MGKNKPVFRGRKQGKSFSLETINNIQMALINDFHKFKVDTSYSSIERNKSIEDLRRENVLLTNTVASFVDLIADITGIPIGAIGQRLVTLCDSKEVVGAKGQIRGSAVVSLYNFGGQYANNNNGEGFITSA